MASLPASASRPRAGLYLAGVLIAGLLILLFARRAYQIQQVLVSTAAEANLQETAALTAARVAAWRAERLADASVTAANQPLLQVFTRVLDGTATPTDRERVLDWMAAMCESYRYANAILLDARGAIQLQSGRLFGRAEQYAALVGESLKIERDLLDVPGAPAFETRHFTLTVGLRSAPGARVGTLLLGIDPADALYSSILTWPASPTGQVALARRTGNAIHFLTPMRGANGRAESSADSGPGSVLERVASGERLSEGEAAGARVLAAGADVPGSPWRLVAAIAHDEAHAAMTEVLQRVTFNAAVFMLVVVAGAGSAYGYQLSTYRRQQSAAERERRELQGHYAFLTSFGNDAILLMDVDDRIVEVNDRALEWFGYRQDEMVGMKVSQLQTADAASDFAGVRRTIRAQGRLVFQTLARRRDGTTIPVEISARQIEIDDRPFSQWILRDISERQRADQQIRRVNRLYAVLSGCSRVVVEARTDLELFDRVCQTAADAGGFRVAAISLVEPGTTTIVPVARAGVSAEYVDRIALATEGPFGAGASGHSMREGRTVVCNDILGEPAKKPWHADAERFGLHSLIALPLRRAGAHIGVLTLYAGEVGFFDQAEARLAEEVADSVSFALDSLDRDGRRRAAEDNLRISRDRLERVLDATNEGYWDWRPDRGDVRLSARFYTMLGYEPDEVPIGWDAWLEMVHPDDRAVVQGLFARFADSDREAFSAEYRMKRKSGDYIWVLSRAKAIGRDSQGAPTRLVGTNTDITERKRLEEQFLQAQKLESVGRLAGGVAHDFNNLLTVVNGYSEILLGNLDAGDPNWVHVDTIRQAGERASAMTRQLLAFSRKQATEPRVLQLNDVVRDFEPLLGRLVGADAELTMRLAAERDYIKADPVQLEQVVMNLIVNARDAMPAGGRIVIGTSEATIGADAADGAPGHYVVLTVTDSGTGMDEATRAHIFEPFFTTKEKGRGTGLGLSTVYGIVRQAGGFIRVDSRLGQGSSFAILWPLAAEPVDRVPAGGAAARPLNGTETVLIVDDLSPVRTLAVRALSARGYMTIAAESGADALRLAAAHDGPIHVLLTDVVMPGLDGPTVAARIADERPGIKVIFTSGYTDSELGQRGLESGFAYLPKPFTPRSLSAKVREVLDVPVQATRTNAR